MRISHFNTAEDIRQKAYKNMRLMRPRLYLADYITDMRSQFNIKLYTKNESIKIHVLGLGR